MDIKRRRTTRRGQMTELQRYLAEEVAEDHADGIITRREAVRRLGLLGVSRRGGDRAARPLRRPRRGRGRGGDGRAARRAVRPSGRRSRPRRSRSPGRAGTLMAAWAPAEQRARRRARDPREPRAHRPHPRRSPGGSRPAATPRCARPALRGGRHRLVPGRGRGGGGAQRRSPPERFDADMQAAVTELKRRLARRRSSPRSASASAAAWSGACSPRASARLAAAAPFYGPFPEGGSLRRSRAAVLGVYGGLDARVNATRAAAAGGARGRAAAHEILTFTEADHAFFNDTGARFNPPAAAEAWRRVLELVRPLRRPRPRPRSRLNAGISA